MSVITSDERDAGTAAHLRRAEGRPVLCGARNGMGFVVAEGEDPGDPWPYMAWCVVCRDAQHGDADNDFTTADRMRLD